MGVNTGTSRSHGGLKVNDNNGASTVYGYGITEIVVTAGSLTYDGHGKVTINTGGGGGGSGTVTSINCATDGGAGTAITTSGTFTYTGGTNITTSISGFEVTIDSDSASTVAAGVTNEVAFYTGANALGGNTKFTYDTTTLTIAGVDAADDTVLRPFTIERTTSGTPTAGIGAGMQFTTETTAGNEIGSAIESVATDVSAGAEDFDLVFRNMEGGAAATEGMRLTSAGYLHQITDSTDSSVTLYGGSLAFGKPSTAEWDKYAYFYAASGPSIFLLRNSLDYFTIDSPAGGKCMEITMSGGDVEINQGSLTVTAGSVTTGTSVSAGTTVSATTTVTGGTGLIATTGDVVASAGNVSAGLAVNGSTVSYGRQFACGNMQALTCNDTLGAPANVNFDAVGLAAILPPLSSVQDFSNIALNSANPGTPYALIITDDGRSEMLDGAIYCVTAMEAPLTVMFNTGAGTDATIPANGGVDGIMLAGIGDAVTFQVIDTGTAAGAIPFILSTALRAEVI